MRHLREHAFMIVTLLIAAWCFFIVNEASIGAVFLVLSIVAYCVSGETSPPP